MFTITLGYIIVMALCIPMGVINLDENIKFQWVSFAGLVVLMAEFTFFFLFESPFYFDQVPAFGTEYKQVASVFVSYSLHTTSLTTLYIFVGVYHARAVMGK
jgi:hypothetical protein